MKICDILNNNESENLLKEWLEFREEELSRMDENDQKHLINFDNYSENTYKMVHYESSYRCFLLEIFGMSEKVPIYAYEK